MTKLNSTVTALLIVIGTMLFSIRSQAQHSGKDIGQSDSQKNKKSMESKIVVGKIEVPGTSIEAFRKQVHVTPNYLKKLPGFVSGEMYEMTDDSGVLHVLSVTTWVDDASYKNAQQKLAEYYKEINFDRMAFREKLNITADYALYVQSAE
jgi:heme-degrading monooxygenase HmoA